MLPCWKGLKEALGEHTGRRRVGKKNPSLDGLAEIAIWFCLDGASWGLLCLSVACVPVSHFSSFSDGFISTSFGFWTTGEKAVFFTS